MDVMDECDFVRFEFDISLGGYILYYDSPM